ncbi:MAG: DUF4340 domain-containing protein [Acidobacteria bacterium]|nr:DUF4340 domain-containing protein [Acidobacteriota bacterium]MYD72405.1 DUF4340 domain-containing protein [Acidobacteriota bacterium]MYJ04469.1 DUF4340 domain-containing protein [Acidobacteriota bacterium]
MQETKKTLAIAGVAILLGVVAFASAPRRAVPDLFFDVGEPFFPEFTDPEAAATLDVVEFDEDTASATPFQVTNEDGLWTIPSHHGYPADGAERLSNIAADIISLTKEDFRSDNVADHEALGVIDPTDLTATSLVGRGTRVTVKDATGETLADLVVGRPVEGRPGLRFVRSPDQKRVYSARFEADISTRFEDWIEQNLLEVERDQVVHMVLNEYQVDEVTRRASPPRTFTVDKVDDTTWTGDSVPAGQEVDYVQMNLLVGAVMNMQIAGVRPKPEGMTGNLRDAAMAGRISREDITDLVNKGFYPTADGGLLSNEGELLVRTTEGVLYTLRFGEIVYGRGDAVLLGDETSDDAETGPGENRYVFIEAEFDEAGLGPEPPASETDAHASWERRVREGQEKADRLATRFARWYYVVAAGSYDRIHKPREEFLKDIEPEEGEAG